MKRLLLLPFFLLCTWLLMGQHKWSYGVSLHAGFSGYSSSDYQEYSDPLFGGNNSLLEEKLQPSLGAGVWVERRLAERWGLYFGLDYTQASAFSHNEFTNYTTEGAVVSFSQGDQYTRQQQLHLPFEVHFYFGRSNHSWRPFLSAGTQLQYLLSQTYTIESLYANGGQQSPETYYYTEKIDLSGGYYDHSRMQMGVNAAIGVAGKRLNLSLRRNWTKGKAGSYSYSDYDCYCNAFGNRYYLDPVLVPHSQIKAFRQLEQMSLRLQYRL